MRRDESSCLSTLPAPAGGRATAALELATDLGASLSLVHVIEPVDRTLTALEHAVALTTASEELERIARLLRPRLREVEALVVEGTPAEGIESAARDCNADLIVMGTLGRRGIARALLGSVAARTARTSSVPVMTVSEHVATCRNEAGDRLATALAKLALDQPNVVALSRGALTVSTTLARRMKGTIDLWGVEPIVTADGIVIGAVGEDGAVALAATSEVTTGGARGGRCVRQEPPHSDLSAIKGARSIGECWRLDVVLVADGLFSEAYARVAIDAIRKLGPKRIVIASPVISRAVWTHLDGKVDGLVALEQATVADACVYGDDVLPSDLVAHELLVNLRPARAESTSSSSASA